MPIFRMPIFNRPRSAGFFGGRFSISVGQHQTPEGVRWFPSHFFIAAAYGQKWGAKTFRHPYISKAYRNSHGKARGIFEWDEPLCKMHCVECRWTAKSRSFLSIQAKLISFGSMTRPQYDILRSMTTNNCLVMDRQRDRERSDSEKPELQNPEIPSNGVFASASTWMLRQKDSISPKLYWVSRAVSPLLSVQILQESCKSQLRHSRVIVLNSHVASNIQFDSGNQVR
jgi:hypothetical protein